MAAKTTSTSTSMESKIKQNKPPLARDFEQRKAAALELLPVWGIRVKHKN